MTEPAEASRLRSDPPNGALSASPPNPGPGGKLKGRMGVLELVVTVLAFSAPIVVVSGFAPFVITFNGGGAPMAFVVAGLMLLVFAVGYSTMSRYVPNPGAFYAYITAGLGRRVGLGASFLALFAYVTMSVGTYAFFGLAVRDFVVQVLGGPELSTYLYAFIGIVAAGILGYFRIDLSAKILAVAMLAEVLIVGIFDGAVVGRGGPEGRTLESFGSSAFTTGSIGLAVVFAVASFVGFEATAIFREETKNPSRTIPIATYTAVTFIGVFYIVSVWALVLAYGPSNAQEVATDNYGGMFTDAMQHYVGVWARDLVSVLIITSAFACVLSVQNILSRYLYSLGTDGVLPAVLSKAHEKHRSPYVSSVTVSVFTFLVLFGWSFTGYDVAATYSLLAGSGGFAILVLMFLTGVAVLLFFRRNRQYAAETTKWNTIIAPLLNIGSMGIVLVLAIANFTTMTGGSTSVAIALQAAVWFTFAAGILLASVYRRSRPTVFLKIGRQ